MPGFVIDQWGINPFPKVARSRTSHSFSSFLIARFPCAHIRISVYSRQWNTDYHLPHDKGGPEENKDTDKDGESGSAERKEAFRRDTVVGTFVWTFERAEKHKIADNRR